MSNLGTVVPGFDPGICLQLAKDRRVKPGDDGFGSAALP